MDYFGSTFIIGHTVTYGYWYKRVAVQATIYFPTCYNNSGTRSFRATPTAHWSFRYKAANLTCDNYGRRARYGNSRQSA